MSSSDSNSSDSAPAKKQQLATRDDSSSDSDFVSAKKLKHAKEKPGPSKDPSTKSAFHQMLMNANSKFTNFKNRQSIGSKGSSPKTPVSSEKKKSKLKNSIIEFSSPVASSTQISFNVESAKKHKQREKEILSDSDSEPHKNKQTKAAEASESDSETTIVQQTHKDTSSKNKTKSKHHDDISESEKQVSSGKKRKISEMTENSSDERQKIKKKARKESILASESDYQKKIRKTSTTSESEDIVPTKRKSKSPQKKQMSFNESDSDTEADTLSSKSLAQLRKFEADSKSLSRVHEQLDSLKSNMLKKEVFLVQIPKGLDPQLLIGTKISLSESTRVPENSRKYDCIPSYDTQDQLAVSFNTEDIHLIKPAGSLNIRRHLKTKHIPDFPARWNDHVAFPNDLKQRHPLFGADYTDKISLEEHVQQKLQAAIEAHNTQKKKKKKKKKHKIKEQDTEVEEEIFKFLSQSAPIKEEIESLEEEEHAVRTEKKKKKEKHDASDTEFEQPKKKHKHKHIKQEVDETGVYGTESSSFSKEIKQEIIEEVYSPKKKKKKHHKDDPF